MEQEQALELLIKSQAEQILRLEETNARHLEQLAGMQEKIDKLLSQVAWFTRQLFGRKSEKLAPLDPNQLSLFETAEDALQREEEIGQARLGAVSQISEPAVKGKKERSMRKMLKDLPVVEVVIEPEAVDPDKYKRIGEERTRTLELKPGELYVREIVRPKYGLRDNLAPAGDGMPGVIIAPLPLLPIHKGLAGASLIAEILLQKYQYHLPFYRQVQQFRHLGVNIPENTLGGWFKPACELLEPLYEVLKDEVTDTDYLQVDETVLPVVSKEAHKANKEYLWVVRSVMKRLVFFHYDNGSRSRETVSSLLKSYGGYLQSDGWQAYDTFDGKEEVCLVACLVHIRRYFEKSLKENKLLSEYFLGEVQKLYRIESMADEQGLSFPQRKELREKLAAPIMDSLEMWMEKTHPTVLPKSLIGEAISYTRKRWGKMRNYLLDGRLKPDNNLCENIVKPIALSRKNFLFCGNHQAAENTAVICSLLGSCKEQGVNPREWLTDVIEKMPYYQKPGNEENLKKLLPNYWRKQETGNSLTIV